MPAVFAVPRYAQPLLAMMKEKAVDVNLNSNLTSIDHVARTATFTSTTTPSDVTTLPYSYLHAVPPMGPLAVLKNSGLVDAAGWVDVDQGSLQSNRFSNVWALGDSSSLATSKTAAAVSSISML